MLIDPTTYTSRQVKRLETISFLPAPRHGGACWNRQTSMLNDNSSALSCRFLAGDARNWQRKRGEKKSLCSAQLRHRPRDCSNEETGSHLFSTKMLFPRARLRSAASAFGEKKPSTWVIGTGWLPRYASSTACQSTSGFNACASDFIHGNLLRTIGTERLLDPTLWRVHGQITRASPCHRVGLKLLGCAFTPAVGIHGLPPSTGSRRTPRCTTERWTPPFLAAASARTSPSAETGLPVAMSDPTLAEWRRRPRKSRRETMTATAVATK